MPTKVNIKCPRGNKICRCSKLKKSNPVPPIPEIKIIKKLKKK